MMWLYSYFFYYYCLLHNFCVNLWMICYNCSTTLSYVVARILLNIARNQLFQLTLTFLQRRKIEFFQKSYINSEKKPFAASNYYYTQVLIVPYHKSYNLSKQSLLIRKITTFYKSQNSSEKPLPFEKVTNL